MTILENREKLIKLAAASETLADILPGHQHLCSWHRWAVNGVRGIRLEVVRAGGALCTSREAVERFFAALSETDAAPQHTTPARRQREIKKAEKACALAGI